MSISSSPSQRPIFEQFESRVLLSLGFATPLAPSMELLDGPTALPLDLYAGSGQTISYNVITGDSRLGATLVQGSTFARINITGPDGTSWGSIVAMLYSDKVPESVERFITLATKHITEEGSIVDPSAGAPAFYSNMSIFRIANSSVSPHFMFQSGNPGFGEPDDPGDSPLSNMAEQYDAQLEFRQRGVLAFANTGAASSSNAQFFVTDSDFVYGNGKYTIFGQVVAGWDLLAKVMSVQGDPYSYPLDHVVDASERPIITSIDIFDARQDAVLILERDASFTADTWLTVQARNDQTGETTSSTIRITGSGNGGMLSPGTGQALDAVVEGSMMYVAMGTAGVYAYDVSNPAAPVFKGLYNTPYYARQLVVRGTTLYVADWTSVQILNASDPTAIKLVGQAQLASTYFFSLAVTDNSLFVAALDKGLVSFDISNPSAPSYRSTLKTLATGVSFSQVTSIDIVGSYAYVADLRAVSVINVSDVQHMKVVGPSGYVVYQGSAPFSLDVEGKRLYVSDVNLGMMAFDITIATAPKLLSGFGHGAGAWAQVRVVGNIAVLSGSGSTLLVDVTDPRNMSVDYAVQMLSYNEGADMSVRGTIAGTHLMLPQVYDGLQVLDAAMMVKRLSVKGVVTIYNGGVWTRVSTVGGKAWVYTTGIGSGAIERIDIPQSNALMSVTITGLGTSAIDIIMAAGSLGTFNARGIALGKQMYVRGSLYTLILGDVQTGASIRIAGSAARGVMATLGHVWDGSMRLDAQGLAGLTVTDWNDTGGASESLVAPWITTILSRGTFDPDIEAGRITRATIGGLNGATWNVPGGIGYVTMGPSGGWTANLGSSGITSLIGTGSLYGTINAGFVTSANVRGAVGWGKWTIGTMRSLLLGSTVEATWSGEIGTVTTVSTGVFYGELKAWKVTYMTVRGDMRGRLLVPTEAINAPLLLNSVGTLYVLGSLVGATITSNGNIGTVSAAGMYDSTITVGGSPDGSGVRGTLGMLTLRGVLRSSSMSNSNVSAYRINTASLANPNTATGVAYGLAAHSYGRVVYTGYTWPRVGEAQPHGQGDFLVQVV
jgi:cyclophilin family peptidyl-prolyl cis-trans isomerase